MTFILAFCNPGMFALAALMVFCFFFFSYKTLPEILGIAASFTVLNHALGLPKEVVALCEYHNYYMGS